jgi:hypothetical protein
LAVDRARREPAQAKRRISSASRYVMSWTHRPHPAILVVRYEDMLEAPGRTFRVLADHLAISATDDEIASAIERSSFAKAKAEEEAEGYRERPAQSRSFFREGRAEQWREALNEAQAAAIVAAHREQMQRFGYVPDGL